MNSESDEISKGGTGPNSSAHSLIFRRLRNSRPVIQIGITRSPGWATYSVSIAHIQRNRCRGLTLISSEIFNDGVFQISDVIVPERQFEEGLHVAFGPDRVRDAGRGLSIHVSAPFR